MCMVSTKGEKKKPRLMTTIEKVNMKYDTDKGIEHKEISICRTGAENGIT